MQILCFDLGSNFYAKSSDLLEIRRLADMALWHAVLALDTVLEHLDADWARPRYGLCNTLVTMMKSTLDNSGCASALEKAKVDLRCACCVKDGRYDGDWKRKHRTSPDGEDIPVSQSGVMVSLCWGKPGDPKVKTAIKTDRDTDMSPPKPFKDSDAVHAVPVWVPAFGQLCPAEHTTVLRRAYISANMADSPVQYKLSSWLRPLTGQQRLDNMKG